MLTTANENFVPMKNSIFTESSLSEQIEKILNSKMFYPVLFTGPTGCGKTLTISQVHSKIGKEMIRVNITIESDEDSLMGGFRLVNGNTVFEKGPVIRAMELGATLLLDELDLGSPSRIMCLQSVLEGDGYLIKKTGEFVRPKPGFTIMATANTKGSGDESGMYVGTQILNEAALDRFPIVIEVDYASIDEERVRLEKVCKSIGLDMDSNKNEIDVLLQFTNEIREAIKKDRGEKLQHAISSRRLSQIIQTFHIFGDMRVSVEYCISRFDSYHKEEYMKIYDIFAKPKNEEEKESFDDHAQELHEQFKSLSAW